MGLLCYKHSWLTFPALEIDKIFLIFIKRYFCCTIIPLLTILVRSSWLDMSLVLFFSVSVTSSRWPHVWSITHIFMTRTSKWCVELMHRMHRMHRNRCQRKSTCHVIDVVSAKTRWPKSHEKDFCEFSTQTAEKHRNRRNFKRSF